MISYAISRRNRSLIYEFKITCLYVFITIINITKYTKSSNNPRSVSPFTVGMSNVRDLSAH